MSKSVEDRMRDLEGVVWEMRAGLERLGAQIAVFAGGRVDVLESEYQGLLVLAHAVSSWREHCPPQVRDAYDAVASIRALAARHAAK
jgi:hypothetical protein